MEDFMKALEYFEKSIEIMPHFKTFERMYYCYKQLGKHDIARRYIEKAYLMNESNDKVAVEFAIELQEEGKIEFCLEVVNKVLKRNPSYGPAKRIAEKNIKIGSFQP